MLRVLESHEPVCTLESIDICDLSNTTWPKAKSVVDSCSFGRQACQTRKRCTDRKARPQGGKVCSKISQKGVEELTKYSQGGYGIIQFLIKPVMPVLSTSDPFYYFPPPLNTVDCQVNNVSRKWRSVSSLIRGQFFLQLSKLTPPPISLCYISVAAPIWMRRQEIDLNEHSARMQNKIL